MSLDFKKLLVWLMVLVTAMGATAAFVFAMPDVFTAKKITYGKGDYTVTVKTTVVKEAVTFPLDINVASAEELMKVPGIGKVYAQRIVEHREQYGGFATLEDLTNIKGSGEKRLEAWREYLCCE